MNSNYEKIEKVIGYLEKNYQINPDLEEISKQVHISPFHLQKVFKSWAGISPKKFIQILNLENIKKKLRNSTISDTSIESGLSSISRVYDLFVNIDAISPMEYKSQGLNLNIYYAVHDTPFGKALICVTSRGINALHFVDNNEEEVLNGLKKEWINAKFYENKEKTAKYIKLIFDKNRKEKVNIFLKGTNFQIQVWKALLTSDWGSLVSYEYIAKAIDKPNAHRAVGTAVGKNPISFLIPCHRVIKKVGLFGNYRWGVNRKKSMIVWESIK